MLKKIVKYGNSNALVLDKAILELLNISEGSIVKLKTDGQSLIITPTQSENNLTVQEEINPNDALLLATAQQQVKDLTQISTEQKTALEQQIFYLTKKHRTLYEKLEKNPQFQKELEELREQEPDYASRTKKVQTLFKKYLSPEIESIEMSLELLNQRIEQLRQVQKGDFESLKDSVVKTTQIKDMQENFREVFNDIFTKQQTTMQNFGQILNSPEYQHRAKLLTEKYEGNQNSIEFMEETKQLMYEFCPEMKDIHEKIAAVAKK